MYLPPSHPANTNVFNSSSYVIRGTAGLSNRRVVDANADDLRGRCQSKKAKSASRLAMPLWAIPVRAQLESSNTTKYFLFFIEGYGDNARSGPCLSQNKVIPSLSLDKNLRNFNLGPEIC